MITHPTKQVKKKLDGIPADTKAQIEAINAGMAWKKACDINQSAYTAHDFTQYKEIAVEIFAEGIKSVSVIPINSLVFDPISYVIGGSYINATYNTSFAATLSLSKAIIGTVYIKGQQITNAAGRIFGR